LDLFEEYFTTKFGWIRFGNVFYIKENMALDLGVSLLRSSVVIEPICRNFPFVKLERHHLTPPKLKGNNWLI
jgi:hypothetical protein